MKILIALFSPPAGTWGSLTRCLALSNAARVRGHETAYCASGCLAERLTALGERVFPAPAATMFGLPRPFSRLLENSYQRITPPAKPGQSIGSVWSVLFVTGMASYGYLRRLVRAQLRAADAMKPDILFNEMDPGAYPVSRIRGIPLACTYSSVSRIGAGSFAWRRVKDAEARVLSDYGLKDAGSPDMESDERMLKIIPSIPELEVELPGRRDFAFVGSLFSSLRTESEPVFRPEPGSRYVFVYVGTGSVGLGDLTRVLPRVFPEGSGPLCLVGWPGFPAERRIGNVIFRPFWDTENLIPRCDWVLCHGGHNTIIQSLSHKVPLIVFPGPIFERRFNAGMVERAGAGYFGERSDFREDWLTQAIRGRAPCAACAAALGEKIRAMGGASKAVELMEAWSRLRPSPAPFPPTAGHNPQVVP